MHIEIPEFLRCCFCLPLRYGILVFGYLNLIFTILLTSWEICLDIRYPHTYDTLIVYRGIGLITYVWLPYILYGMDIVFNIVLIIGAHIKCTSLIRAYYYFSITTTIAVFITLIVVRYENQIKPFELCLAFSSFVLQIYLLLQIRSELNKVRYQEGQSNYVNHMAEVTVEQPARCGRNPL